MATKETALLGAVPVKLDRVVGLAFDDVLGLEQGTKDLEDGHGTTAIIVGAGRGQDRWQPKVDGILVGTNDDCAVRLARNCNNNTALLPCVGERRGGDVLIGTRILDDGVDLGEKPLGRLAAVV